MKRIFYMKWLILNDLFGKKYNLFGLGSAGMSFIVDLFSNESIGSISAVLISTLLGLFSIWKAFESAIETRDDRIRRKKVEDAKADAKIKDILA